MADSHEDRWNVAISRRLARLRSRPVDTKKFDAWLNDLTSAPVASMPGTSPLASFKRSFAWAAMVAMVLGVGIGVLVKTRAEVAEPSGVVRLHEEVLSGESGGTIITTLAEAQFLSRERGDWVPDAPSAVDGTLRLWCVCDTSGVPVTCLQVDYDGQPVTVVIAERRQLRPHRGEAIELNGQKFQAHRVGPLNIVMTQVADYTICVVAELPADRLATLAATVAF